MNEQMNDKIPLLLAVYWQVQAEHIPEALHSQSFHTEKAQSVSGIKKKKKGYLTETEQSTGRAREFTGPVSSSQQLDPMVFQKPACSADFRGH